MPAPTKTKHAQREGQPEHGETHTLNQREAPEQPQDERHAHAEPDGKDDACCEVPSKFMRPVIAYAASANRR